MKILTGKQDAITQYKQQSIQPIIYEAEVVDLHPEPVADIDFFRCPTAEDIAQAEQELEQTRKLSYWQWLKSVLG